MNRDERTVAVATLGLAIAAVGLFLPWARVGGRRRSGFATADTFTALSENGLPDVIAWVGRWWYLPAFLVVLAWASVLAHGHIAVRVGGVAFLVVALVMWWIFVWAADHWNVLKSQYSGPAVATIGIALVGYACSRSRSSVLQEGAPPSAHKDLQ